MLSEIYSAGLSGIDSFIVTVEVDGAPVLPYFELVGLPDAAVKEAKERVRTACFNSGFRFPELGLTVNLAPADRRKEGSAFDLAILVGILRCAGVIKRTVPLERSVFAGELSLSGDVRPVRGALCMCAEAKKAGMSRRQCARGGCGGRHTCHRRALGARACGPSQRRGSDRADRGRPACA